MDDKSMENLRSYNLGFKRNGIVAKIYMINRCPLWEKQIPSVINTRSNYPCGLWMNNQS